MTCIQRKLKLLVTRLIGRNKTVKCVALATPFFVTIVTCIRLYDNIRINDYFHQFTKSFYHDDNSCYNIKDYNNNSADLVSFRRNSIFLIRTACGILKFHEACAIESAATTHIDKPINVLYTSPTPKCLCHNKFLEYLLTLNNVEFFRIYLKTYVLKTPIDYSVIQNILKKKRNQTILKDVLKLLTLYKYGGIVVDLDLVLAKSLYALKLNFAVREDSRISTAIVAIQRKLAKRFMTPIMRLLNNQTHIDERTSGNVLTDATKTICLHNKTEETPETIFNNDATVSVKCNCDGIRLLVFNPYYFHPIKREEWYKYYDSEDTVRFVMGYNTYASEHAQRTFNNESLYARIAENSCPVSYGIYLRRFEDN